MTNKGFDYGMGVTNIDTKTGIRYGVIPEHSVLQVWCDESDLDYGEPSCPECGNSVRGGKERDYYCPTCGESFWSDQCFPEEAVSSFVDTDELVAESDSSGDIWIFKSEYYTKAKFCSPCAPGACYLLDYCEEGEKTYCFGWDWFTEPCPYPYWRVADDSLVYEPKEKNSVRNS